MRALSFWRLCCTLMVAASTQGCDERHGVVTERPAGADGDAGAAKTDPDARARAVSPPAELSLELEGPHPSLSEVCADLETRVLSNFGDMERGEVGFTCRTDVALEGRDPPGLTGEELGGAWQTARFLISGTSVRGYWAELRLLLQTSQGWFVSEQLLHITQGNLPHRFVRLDLQALPLAPGEGRELFAVAGHEWGFERREANDQRGTHYGEEFTVVCTLEAGAPRCLFAPTAWFQTEFTWDGFGSRRVEKVVSDERGTGTVAFPDHGVLELAYPGVQDAEKRNLAGTYRW